MCGLSLEAPVSGQTPQLASALRSELVRAGAGAGKTTYLIEKVIHDSLQFRKAQGRWPRLIITTFTRNATQELKERLLAEAIRRESSELLEFVSSKHYIFISTIHGVLNLFLKRYGHLLGIDPNFTMADEAQVENQAKKILREVLTSDPEHLQWLETLSFQELSRWVTHFANMIREHSQFKPADIETFQGIYQNSVVPAARSLELKAAEVLKTCEDPKYSEFVNRIARAAKLLQITPTETIYEELAADIESVGSPPGRKRIVGLTDLNDLWKSEILELFEENLLDPKIWAYLEEHNQKFAALAQVFSQKWREFKNQSGLFQFEDLELEALQASAQFPEMASVFSSEWDYWMVDEYQDTSPRQVRLLKSLMGDRPHFVVGDPQQSIYLFRGARSEVFHNKAQEFAATDAIVEERLINYRSRPELLSFINDIFTQWSNQFKAMTPREQPSAGETAPVAQLNVQANLQAENQAIYQRIVELVQSGETFGSICILGRTRKHLEDLAQFLRLSKIPVYVHSSGGFADRREIGDALSLLQFVANPHDNMNLLCLLRSPWAHVLDSELVEALREVPSDASYWRELSTRLYNHPSIQMLKSWLEKSKSGGVVSVFSSALIQCGLFNSSYFYDPSGRRESNLWKLVTSLEAESRKPGFNIFEFIDTLTFGAEEGEAVAALEPNQVNLMTIHGAKGLQFKHVFLSRMGEPVRGSRTERFMIDEELGRWSLTLPHPNLPENVSSLLSLKVLADLKAREKMENERLLYVALTRASESLHLSWNGTPKAGSWAEALRFLNSKEGVHQRDGYRYEVRTSPPVMSVYELAESKKASIRSQWKTTTSAGIQRVSVSQLLSSSSGQIEEPRAPGDLRQAIQGQMIHQLFESFRNSPNLNISDFVAQRSSDDNLLPSVTRAIEFVTHLSKPPMASLLKDGYSEWGFQFAVPDSSLRLEGQIDLWGIHDKKVWIVDYKTGSQKHLAKAFDQLELYAIALAQHLIEIQAEFNEVYLSVVYVFANRAEVRLAEPPERALRKLKELSTKSLQGLKI